MSGFGESGPGRGFNKRRMHGSFHQEKGMWGCEHATRLLVSKGKGVF
jgi:hypothetical protein